MTKEEVSSLLQTIRLDKHNIKNKSKYINIELSK